MPFGRKSADGDKIPTHEEGLDKLMEPIGPGEWERKQDIPLDLDKPTFERHPYRKLINPEEAKARLDNIGKENMPLELVPPTLPARPEMADPQGVASDVSPLTIEWLVGAPTMPGCYWIRDSQGELNMAAVQMFGGRLCLVARSGDGVTYRAVTIPKIRWAGPIPVPADVSLTELNERLA